MRRFKDNLNAYPHSKEAREILKDPEKRKALYEKIKEERFGKGNKAANDNVKSNGFAVKREILVTDD